MFGEQVGPAGLLGVGVASLGVALAMLGVRNWRPGQVLFGFDPLWAR
ncbi:hypothetical protein [Saccharospirillum sp.]